MHETKRSSALRNVAEREPPSRLDGWCLASDAKLSYITCVDDEDEDDDDDEDDEDEEGEDDAPELKMMLCVRTDKIGGVHKMGKGKMCAQCCHAAVGAYKRAMKKHPKIVRRFDRYGSAKVAVKVQSEEQLLALHAEAVGLSAGGRKLKSSQRNRRRDRLRH